MSDAEVLGTLAEAFERMSAGASPTGNYFFQVNVADAAASLKRIDVAASEIDRLRGDLEVARLRLEAAHAEIGRLRLTDAEREAVRSCIADDEAATAYQRAATLRGLLERLGATNKTDGYVE